MWTCPLNGKPDCKELHAISTDGGLRHANRMVLPELGKQGWEMVLYPKRNYYPEKDRTSVHYKPEDKEEENFDMIHVDPV